MTGPADLLRRRGFRRLYLARASSQTADGVFEASLFAFTIFSPEKATSPSQIAGALAVVLLPFSLLGPFVGIVIDRVSRQRVLVVAALVRVVVLLTLAGLFANHTRGAPLYLAALLGFSANRFVLSALSAATPVVVAQADLVTANALSTTSGTVVTLIGAALGTGIRAVAGAQDSGVALVALTAAGAYLLAAFAASRNGRRDLGPIELVSVRSWRQDVGRVVADMLEGARHLAARERARDALLALSVHRFAYGLSFVSTVLLYRNYFGGANGSLGGLAAVIGVSGVGTAAAALVTPSGTRRFGKAAWITGSFAAAAVAEVVFGAPYTTRSFLVAALVLGFVAQASKICVDTFIQEEVLDAYRGRAFSVYDVLFNVTYVGAAALGALLLPATGKSYVVLGFIASLYAVAALGYRLASRGQPVARPVGTGAVPDSPRSEPHERGGGSACAAPALDQLPDPAGTGG